MTSHFIRAAHVDLQNHCLELDYLDGLFAFLAANGYNAILMAYRSAFPYRSLPELSREGAYTAEEVNRIDESARHHGLEIIPLGQQFTHSGDILGLEKFKLLDGGGGSLDLSSDESLELMIKSGEDLLRLHPRTRLLHFGGDEIMPIGASAASGRAVRELGASQYYVRFVNRLAQAFADKGVSVCVWSDMLIRYPQAAERLDTSVVIFYWDYWSSGPRTPFVTIGGGIPDMFILDADKLHGDQRKLLIHHAVRQKDDLPVGHLERFGKYWDMPPDRTNVRSFPYLAWFKQLGLRIVGALTTYPEKSSFLPDFRDKLDHVRWFAKRIQESSGDGFVACLWPKHFPLITTCAPSFASANALMRRPDSTDAEICAETARRLGGDWTAATLEAYFGIGSDFECADLLTPLWSDKPPLVDRLEWLRDAGELENDMAMCRASLAKAEALLNGPWRGIPAERYERFAVEDLAWRASVQIAWLEHDTPKAEELLAQGRSLESRCGAHLRGVYRPCHHAEILRDRYQPWHALLESLRLPKKNK